MTNDADNQGAPENDVDATRSRVGCGRSHAPPCRTSSASSAIDRSPCSASR